MNEAVQFFYDNAGSSFDPSVETAEEGRQRGALRLAAAEQLLKGGPFFVTWERDPEPWDGDEPYDGPLWIAKLWSVQDTSDPELLLAVGSVACKGGDPYQRVIEAELMMEHMASIR